MSLRSTLTYGFITVATLAVAEIAARTYDWAPRDKTEAGDKLGIDRYRHSRSGVGDLLPEQDGHWTIWFHRPYHVETNSLGLRNTEEPRENAFRVLALGDSQTFGPYLANDDTWPAWTETDLRTRHKLGDGVQVFNGGIAGYTILDELQLMQDKGLAFKPKLVVLGVFENDLYDMGRERNGRVQRPFKGTAADEFSRDFKRFFNSLAMVRLAKDFNAKKERAEAGVDIKRGEGVTAPPDPAKIAAELEGQSRRYAEVYREFHALLKSAGIPLAVIFIPAPNSDEGGYASQMEPLIRRLTIESATPYLDLTPVMTEQPESPSRLYLLRRDHKAGWAGNGHLSRAGNAVIGAAVSDWLLERGLVPKP